MQRFVDERWEHSILPVLQDYVHIPNRSPAFDANWQSNGYMEAAVDLLAGWAEAQETDGMVVEVLRLPGRTPLIVAEVPPAAGSARDTVLLYGHLDKQPEMTGWRDGLGPWEPVLQGGRLYGRGAADDGYAAFAAITAIAAARECGGAHARCLVVIEASEESGSPDLPAYVDQLGDRLGDVSLVVCLDSGCATYDRLWTTTSLRGLVATAVRVDIVTEGIHSGATGVVPSSFRILRHLLERVEDSSTGDIRLPELHVDIPAERQSQATEAAAVLGRGEVVGSIPFVDGAGPVDGDPAELLVNRTWRPALAVTGAAGLPAIEDAGNVLRPSTTLQLSIRIPPTCDPERALAAVERTLATDVPYGAKVTLTGRERAPGWDAPETAPWLASAIEDASTTYFGQPAGATGEGGTIPFMGMLGERFPAAQFLVVGVLGPGANAHGPNEFLDLSMARRLTSCVASVLDHHAARS